MLSSWSSLLFVLSAAATSCAVVTAVPSARAGRVRCHCNSSFTHSAGDGGGVSRDTPKLSTVDTPEVLAELSTRLGVTLQANPAGYDNWIRPGPLQMYTGPLPYSTSGWDPACHSHSNLKPRRMDGFGMVSKGSSANQCPGSARWASY